MKISRNELLHGIELEKREISMDTYVTKGMSFSNDKLYCNITSEIIPNGFKVNVLLTFFLQNDCDRCLEQFENKQEPSFDIILTTEPEKHVDNDLDIIHFPETRSKIDLRKSFQDVILLEKAIKYLCKKECKGLCQNCGVNLNMDECNCSIISSDNSFGILQNIIKQ